MVCLLRESKKRDTTVADYFAKFSPILDVGLLVVMIWVELCTTFSSICHHHLHHPLLQ